MDNIIGEQSEFIVKSKEQVLSVCCYRLLIKEKEPSEIAESDSD